MAVHPRLEEKAKEAQDDMELYVVSNQDHEHHDKLVAAATAISDMAEGKGPSIEDAKELIDLVPIPDHSRDNRRNETPEEGEASSLGLGTGSAASVRSLSDKIIEKNIEVEELPPLENLKETSRSFIARQASDEEGREISINLAEKAYNSIEAVKELAQTNLGLEKAVDAIESMSKGNAPTIEEGKAVEKLFETMDIVKAEKNGEIEVGEFAEVPASVRNLVETSRMQIKIAANEAAKENAEGMSR